MAISDIPDNSERHRGTSGGGGGVVRRIVGNKQVSTTTTEPNANNFRNNSNNKTTTTEINDSPTTTTTGTETTTPGGMNNVEYGWLEPRPHDPIATDTNLAEIDFEDFRNEDLAYAFSCGVRSMVIS